MFRQGLDHHRAGRLGAAQEAYTAVLKRRPDHAGALHHLGVVRRAQGQPAQAVALMRAAVVLTPGESALHANLGRALRETGDSAAAARHFARAIALDPSFALARSMLCNALREAGAPEAAVAVGRACVVAEPGLLEAWLNLGHAWRALGRIAETEAAYRHVLALDPDHDEALYSLSDLRPYRGGDGMVPRALEDLYVRRKAAGTLSEAVVYGLAKVRHDRGDAAGAFALWQEGGAMRRAAFAGYRVEQDLDLMRRIAAAFRQETLLRWSGAGPGDATPIFVVGMPRSGTTLVEQILSSHPQVAGAGELETLRRLAFGVGAELGAEYPEWIGRPGTGRLLHEVGRRYLAGLRARFPQAPRVVDKMPANFLHLGLIALALPRAKIVRLVRDPLDTCLSCFSKRFTVGNRHTYDLRDLGRYHRGYERLMDHWRTVLPPGMLIEVAYADLVTDFEPQVRRLLAFCGLDWDDRCLRFHETDRPVLTASAGQVRAPLYATSLGRAERDFGALLDPLRRALAEDDHAGPEAGA